MWYIRYFILLALAISVTGRGVIDDVLDEEWKLFKLKYSKVYESLFEERHRYKVFLKNKLWNIQHNRLYELGQVSFEVGINDYSDLEHNEFLTRMTGGLNSSITNIDPFESEAKTFLVPDFDVPDSVDWSEKGAVTEVKNQGQCGSCVAFAVTGALEGQYFLKTGKLLELSEQNLVDCSKKYGNNGCKGGSFNPTYKYLIANGGIETEQSYPYEAKEGNCRYDSKFNSGAIVKGTVKIPPGDEDALKKAIAIHGPIGVAIDASPRSFASYKSGVYYDPDCVPTHRNHALLAVGYGTMPNGEDYWIIKNSWGEDWGWYGYIFMARNRGDNCGISTDAMFPLV